MVIVFECLLRARYNAINVLPQTQTARLSRPSGVLQLNIMRWDSESCRIDTFNGVRKPNPEASAAAEWPSERFLVVSPVRLVAVL